VISKLTNAAEGVVRHQSGPASDRRTSPASAVFAIGILRSFQKLRQSLAKMMRNLAFNKRLVFKLLTHDSKFRCSRMHLTRTNLPCPAEGDPLKFSDGFTYSRKLCV
jgi:hypothetical protein